MQSLLKFAVPSVLVLCFLAVINAQSAPLFKVFTQPTPIYRGRADPIVDPGAISQHSHKVFGASRFSLGGGKTAVELYDDLLVSQCTTSSITQDLSNYWIPDLYYQWPNGTISLVPNGGLTVYYFGRSGNGPQAFPDYQAFPAGFRMIAGDPFRRNFSGSVPETAISYACLSVPGGPETNYFPTATRQCVNGLRAQVFFPQCWDGVNIDSHNHQDHVAYPTIYNNGDCPASHPVRIPAVFYEVLFSVDQDKFPHGNGTQPFAWSCGDGTGYGLHGDFLNGWPVDLLHQAMHDVTCYANNTNNGNDPQNCLTLQPYVKANNPDLSCIIENPITGYEDLGLNHLISHLPGNNPITYGPLEAVPAFGSYAQVILPGVNRVLIQSPVTELYWSSLTDNAPSLLVDVAQVNLSAPQVFEFIALGSGLFGIVTESTSHWVSSNNGGNPLSADRNSASGWEEWTITYVGASGPTQAGTTGYFISNNNRYVQVLSNGELIANATTLNANALFTIYDADAGVPDTRTG